MAWHKKAILPICSMTDHFSDFSLAFFLLNESEISERASRLLATEELGKGL